MTERGRKTQLTAALCGRGIPLLRGIGKKDFLPFQVVALDACVSPPNLSFYHLCNGYAVLHGGDFWMALCWNKKEARLLVS